MADISLREKPFLAHWGPGVIVTLFALFYVSDSGGVRLFWRLSSRLQSTTLLILLVASVSFGVGQVLDAIRDSILEDLFDELGSRLPEGACLTRAFNWVGIRKINWDFFVVGDQHSIDNLEVWFYSHYMLTFNLGFGMLVLLLLPWWRTFPGAQTNISPFLRILLFIASVSLLYDAARLRSHVARLTNDHHGEGISVGEVKK